MSVPWFTLSSTPPGAEDFITLDQVKGEFKIAPNTADHTGTFTVKISMVAPADEIEFALKVVSGGIIWPWIYGGV